ncbi:MAG: hypothetical protein WDO24_00445 [Pseudomonadota bacterium]
MLPIGVWYDLIEPTAGEIRAVETLLKVELPRREEMQEIEISSRLYQDGETLFIDRHADEPGRHAAPGERRHHLRRHAERARDLALFPTARFSPISPTGSSGHRRPAAPGDLAFLGLLEAIVDRAADVLERTASEIEAIARGVFESKEHAAQQHRSLKRGAARHRPQRHADLGHQREPPDPEIAPTRSSARPRQPGCTRRRRRGSRRSRATSGPCTTMPGSCPRRSTSSSMRRSA